jgi:hypothetical protein
MDYFDDRPEAQPEQMPMLDSTLAKMNAGAGTGIALQHIPTVTEMLMHKKAMLEYELKQVDHALEVAKEQQGAMGLLDAIAKTRVTLR